MGINHQRKTLFAISWFIAIFIIIASGVGLLDPNIYAKETPNWHAQSIAQDLVNLFLIAPFLIITSVLAFKANKIAEMLWSGVIFYLIYTYTIYCFDVHFNSLFILYCLILGSSFYSFIYFLLKQSKKPIIHMTSHHTIFKITGIYLIAIACIIYLTWLSSIIPAVMMGNTIPKELVETGLATNPVYALDLSVCLPGLFIVGLLAFKGKPIGLTLAPALLVFCILMNITIGIIAMVMKIKGFHYDLSVTMAMSVLALFSIVLLLIGLKDIKYNALIPG
ncbi:hypothetical protein [Solitalea koreensis]|uniref:Uncharacterized protein n=1 Tax=Solitalea koreensis TaxID=543615 RepID=A0A521D2U0_9SPHI|nr:hypothetical protein [Solitalea koreensis]SMO66008.1 hypothetical protein SAMN06265350_105223 [Solitalea koreensis]